MLHQKSSHQYLIWKAQSRKIQILIRTTQLSIVLGTMILEQNQKQKNLKYEWQKFLNSRESTNLPQTADTKGCVVCAHTFLGKNPVTVINVRGAQTVHSRILTSSRFSLMEAVDLGKFTCAHLRANFCGNRVEKRKVTGKDWAGKTPKYSLLSKF